MDSMIKTLEKHISNLEKCKETRDYEYIASIDFAIETLKLQCNTFKGFRNKKGGLFLD